MPAVVASMARIYRAARPVNSARGGAARDETPRGPERLPASAEPQLVVLELDLAAPERHPRRVAELEARLSIEARGDGELAERRELDRGEARPRIGEAGVEQSAAEACAARPAGDEEPAKARVPGRLAGDRDAAGQAVLVVYEPGSARLGIARERQHQLRHTAPDVGLEGRVEAVLLGVFAAVEARDVAGVPGPELGPQLGVEDHAHAAKCSAPRLISQRATC